MNSTILVSIIIPCFNSGKTVEKAIASATAQTWSNLEVIVINDGSTDPYTKNILNELKNVRVIHQNNKGLPSARNAGFASAKGEYVLPLDADDWLEPDAVEYLLTALSKNPEASFSFSPIILEGEASGTLMKSYNYFEQLFFNQLPYCLLMPKRIWQQTGGYNTEMRDGYEDWEFNIKLGRLGFFGTASEKPVFHYNVSQDGMLLSKSSSLHFKLWTIIQQKNRDAYDMKSLMTNWIIWKRCASTYPLFLYFIWLIVSKLLPATMLTIIFSQMLNYSHSRRLTKQTQKRAN